MIRESRLTGSPTALPGQLPETADLEFYSEQVRDLYPRVLRLARRLVGNPADAEEVVQEALLKAFQHVQDYRHEAAFSTWLLRITWNESMDFHRKRSMELIGLDDLAPGYENRQPSLWAAVRQTPEQICIARDIEELLDRSLRQVKPCYRIVWLLREIDHMSDAEIAKHLGVCLSTVKVRMHRARRQLRRFVGARLSRPAAARHYVGSTRSAIASAENVIRQNYAPAADECPAEAACTPAGNWQIDCRA
jgi:RNA polymerase sigma-70 factor (ECF subfamily)